MKFKWIQEFRLLALWHPCDLYFTKIQRSLPDPTIFIVLILNVEKLRVVFYQIVARSGNDRSASIVKYTLLIISIDRKIHIYIFKNENVDDLKSKGRHSEQKKKKKWYIRLHRSKQTNKSMALNIKTPPNYSSYLFIFVCLIYSKTDFLNFYTKSNLSISVFSSHTTKIIQKKRHLHGVWEKDDCDANDGL